MTTLIVPALSALYLTILVAGLRRIARRWDRRRSRIVWRSEQV